MLGHSSSIGQPPSFPATYWFTEALGPPQPTGHSTRATSKVTKSKVKLITSEQHEMRWLGDHIPLQPAQFITVSAASSVEEREEG